MYPKNLEDYMTLRYSKYIMNEEDVTHSSIVLKSCSHICPPYKKLSEAGVILVSQEAFLVHGIQQVLSICLKNLSVASKVWCGMKG